MIIRRYSNHDKEVWNEHVSSSINGTFLIDRNFMDYHADRYEDHSLIIQDKKSEIIGVFPCNKKGDSIISHGGLTYGGLIVNDRFGTNKTLKSFNLIIDYCKKNNLNQIIYKPVPIFYHRKFFQADIYAIENLGGKLHSRSINSILSKDEFTIRKDRLRGAKRAKKQGVEIVNSDSYENFWKILEHGLSARHSVQPVHSLEEIIFLSQKFPNNIRLKLAQSEDGVVLAGTVFFIMQKVIHTQYMMASDIGKKMGALDLLILESINNLGETIDYVSFGISTEENGRKLNHGLIDQKEAFGSGSLCQDMYVLDL